jgi:hypothetical protein
MNWASDVGSGNWDGEWSVPGSDIALPNTDFTIADGTVNFGDRDSVAKVDVTIPANNSVQFNRDMIFQIEGANNAKLGNIASARVTILFRKGWGEAQPAGAVDRTFNPDVRVQSLFNYTNGTSYPVNNPNPGANGQVNALQVQSDGKTIIGGIFTAYDNVPFKRIARVDTNGWPDLTFNPGDGANASVSALKIDSQGRILVGGQFTSMNGMDAPHIARLNKDGSVDTTFSPGNGANGQVFCIEVQEDGKILIGGEFTTYDGQEQAKGLMGKSIP